MMMVTTIAGALIKAINLKSDSASGLPKIFRLPVTRPMMKINATGKTELNNVSIMAVMPILFLVALLVVCHLNTLLRNCINPRPFSSSFDSLFTIDLIDPIEMSSLLRWRKASPRFSSVCRSCRGPQSLVWLGNVSSCVTIKISTFPNRWSSDFINVH